MSINVIEIFSPVYWIFVLLLIWSFAWKGYAMWIAIKNRQHGWIYRLLLLNTVGILDILYIYIFSKHYHKQKK